MNVKVPTVTIKGDKGSITINEADYDEKIHELVDEKTAKKETAAEKKARLKFQKEAAAETQTNNDDEKSKIDLSTLGVLEENAKHFIVDNEANKIELEGVEVAGYDDAATAWVAIAELKK